MKVVVIADDLTGSNATGGLLCQAGLPTFVSLTPDAQPLDRYSAVVYSTNTRNSIEEDAKEAVALLLGILPKSEITLLAKRIDSTLRGNIRTEIQTMQAQYPDHLVILMPVFPSAHRYCIQGELYLGTQRLHETEAARDPFSPVLSAQVSSILQLPTCSLVSLEDIQQGTGHVAQQLSSLYQQGQRLVVVDGKTEQDILQVAQAVLTLNFPVICADPGPFTAKTAQLMLQKKKQTERILLVVGSTSETTRGQVQYLLDQKSNYIDRIPLHVQALLEYPNQEIPRVLDELLASHNRITLLYTDTLLTGIVETGLEARIQNAKSIQESLASIVREVVQQRPSIRHIISTGGDITAALCAYNKVPGIELVQHVRPLIAHGRIQLAGREIQLITKGGMAGDLDAYDACVQYIWEES